MKHLIEILDVFSRDATSHVVGPPATDQDLKLLERALGHPLPKSFHTFLGRFGGGLFYQGHEIFGPHRVVIHDIELVPSLPLVMTRLREEHLAPGLVPFHRGGGLVHLFDCRTGSSNEGIVSLPAGSTYTDLATFLEAVVLPPGTVSTQG